ncbi:hypothetical protein T484DRAFT_1855471 [Baffinella frigidus]|nr:hypothetical protein T484DRAFT_1855471 [Cryptophyta sp. CCMP2293]
MPDRAKMREIVWRIIPPVGVDWPEERTRGDDPSAVLAAEAALGVLLSSTDAFSPVQGPASFLARSLGRSKADTLFRTCEFLLTLFLAVAWSLIANPIIGALKMLGILKLASPPGDLRGKVAIVSGASTGIGRSTAAALAANGANPSTLNPKP